MPLLKSASRAVRDGVRTARDFLSRELRLPLMSNTSQGLMVPDDPYLRAVVLPNDDEAKRQRAVLKARALHNGTEPVALTARQKEYLGVDADQVPRVMVARTVTTAVSERLNIVDVVAEEGGLVSAILRDDPVALAQAREDPDSNLGTRDDALTEWAREVWFDNSRMHLKQSEMWDDALSEGEHFILIEWNANANDGAGEVELIPHPRFIEAGLTEGGEVGDGFGMMMFYPNGDVSRRPLFAVKRSTEASLDEKGAKEARVTIYFDNCICKWRRARSGWLPLYESFDEFGGPVWPEPWVDPNTGKDLGIPVVHVRTPKLRSEARDAGRFQRAATKQFLDFQQASDETAFRMWKFFGFDPKGLTIAPNALIGSKDAKGNDGAVLEPISGEDPTPLMAGLKDTIGIVAMVANTPTSRFRMDGVIARAETQAEQDLPIEARVEARQLAFGQNVADALNIARRVHNAFAARLTPEAGLTERLNEKPRFKAVWKAFRKAQPPKAEAKQDTKTVEKVVEKAPENTRGK